jgi:predicted nucleic acid-binding protein
LLTASISLDAARLSVDSGLATADAIMLASARAQEAVLWRQDSHFEGMDGVEHRAKR